MNWDKRDWASVVIGWAIGLTAFAALPEHWRLIAVILAFATTWVVRSF